MANKATPTGAIRPKTLVSLATLEKRIRRHLARQGHTLVKSRPGTKAHEHYGRYSIHDSSFELLAEHINLESRCRAYGLLAENEAVDGGEQ